MEYRVLHGRTYHSAKGNTDYWEPNDEKQANSMDLLHHTLTVLFDDKLFMAPISPEPKKVLDVGCGTGTWAIDFADAYPKCEVIGTDISPMQPHWVPVNLRFEIDNCTISPWTFAPNSFDFIHARYLFGAIRDWDALYAEMFRACKPGGWAEAVEPSIFICSDDDSVCEGDGSALSAWAHLFREANHKYGAKSGQGPRPLDMLERDTILSGFRRAGFVDIVQRTVKCPLAPYSKDPRQREVGLYGRAAMEEGMEGFVLYLYIKGLGWSHEQVTIYLSHLRRELRDPRKTPYIKIQCVFGRKPLNVKSSDVR
ncbi:S-adenosyl-L-methionine-dependent methyltransferase [Hypoxylon trugodes]|uniref:S-adenosyl-L-methionine-dependent methyltransferase n=1 Tax=Hypoxylon trugodes TaxID=326681 RepID=UPI002199408C|nr:S-adenosyl-L-methionine-dependent methyltransferase [Hypoxylon trugodes]KAI1389997.1 S-adenosyl-L-methionine-dependent methyltransferase [Hypoxylon trugodes]